MSGTTKGWVCSPVERRNVPVLSAHMMMHVSHLCNAALSAITPNSTSLSDRNVIRMQSPGKGHVRWLTMDIPRRLAYQSTRVSRVRKWLSFMNDVMLAKMWPARRAAILFVAKTAYAFHASSVILTGVDIYTGNVY